MAEIFNIYKEVADSMGGEVSEKEVRDIFINYIKTINKEIKKNPEREIYFPKFGKWVIGENKIKKRLRIFFKLRQVEKTKKMIKILRTIKKSRGK